MGSKRPLFCPGIRYAIFVRQPVSHALSYLNMALKDKSKSFREFFDSINARAFQEYIDKIDRTEVGSEGARDVIAEVLRVSADSIPKYFERDSRTMSAITSNFLTRSLLGERLGSTQQDKRSFNLFNLRPSEIAALPFDVLAEARWALSQFDIGVIRLEELGAVLMSRRSCCSGV